MKLLVNLCAHDGIISQYTGVGSMVKRYITAFSSIFENSNIEYEINLFTPEYDEKSFGFSSDTIYCHEIINNIKIFQISNGTNGTINYGTPDHWEALSINTARIINKINFYKYDLILTIANDTPYASLISLLSSSTKHKKVWVPHSTGKIHKVDSAVEDSISILNARIVWEQEAINYINQTLNCFVATIGKFIKSHLIEEYNLLDTKCTNLINGEILSETLIPGSILENEKLYKKIDKKDSILLSFGRAEEYKNLEATMLLSNEVKIDGVVIAQSYNPKQPILKNYKNSADRYKSLLYIDPPFSFAKYILVNYSNPLILLVPSKVEIMGLIVNEVRKLNKPNILIVANNIDGIKEQIEDGVDGILVDLNDMNGAGNKILKYMNNDLMSNLNTNAQLRLNKDYNLIENSKCFLRDMGVI